MEFLIFPAIGVLIVSIAVLTGWQRRRKLARLSVVKSGVDYPNNHHVLGVGYFHAASGLWYPYPWNEYRENRGYYWNGIWNRDPDQRMVLKSMPTASEVERVNQEWRKADPDRVRQFWAAVEYEGFGTAIRRSEGS
jgi:hypothetical protein